MASYTFHKSERLCSKRAIDELFGGVARSFACYPVRVVYKERDDVGGATQVLMSVSKRRLRRAVDRNRAKRQLREAYRLNKGVVAACRPMYIAFVWLSDEPVASARVHKAMRTVLARINDNSKKSARLDVANDIS